ncbi:MAG: transglycosylase family protein [Actinomycetes bacterium]
MPISTKLVALVASAAVLATGGTAAVVSATAAPTAIVARAVSGPVSTEVSVWVDNTTHLVSVPEPTVAKALAAANITLSATDRVSPSLETPLSAGDVVTVNRVAVAQETTEVVLEFATTSIKDSSLAKGEKKVKTQGSNGSRTDVTETVTVDGQVESTRQVSQTVTKEPVNQVVLVGTKVAPKVTSRSAERTAAPAAPSQPAAKSGTALNVSNAAMWDRIAQCESTGRWNINTGNGYYGGLQFSLPTWRSVNGTDFAAYPHQASREEQITVANRLYAKAGLQPWGCRHAA